MALEFEDDVPEVDHLKLVQEQEIAQAPVSLFSEFDYSDIDQISTEGQALTSDMMGKLDAAICLEAIATYIDGVSKRSEISRHTLAMANVAIEEMLEKAEIPYGETVMFSMESYDDQDQVSSASSGIKEKVGQILSYLKKRLVVIARYIARLMSQFRREMRKLEEKIIDLTKQISSIERWESHFKYVKAESWCEYLSYTNGFDVGLKNVVADVNEFISQHTEMAGNAVSKYREWLINNAGGPDSAISSLEYHPHDFRMDGMSVFSKSLGIKTPKGTNIFYRTKELPGARAYYIESDGMNRRGGDALKSLENIDFSMDYYSPNSYNTMKMKIAAVAAMPVTAWLYLVNPLLGLAATGAASAYISSQKTDVEKKISIDKATLFSVLDKNEMLSTLKGVKDGIELLKQWEVMVLDKSWKTSEIDNAIDLIVDSEVSAPQLRSMCNALISMMTKITTGVPGYAFRVYGASLNYVEKSLKQYA